MTDRRAFGDWLAEQRAAHNLSRNRLAQICGVDSSTIDRVEDGTTKQPTASLLASVAEALDLDPAEVFHRAGIDVGSAHSLPLYFRQQYRHLPPPAQAELQRYFQLLTERYGMDNGPADGEDEI